MLTMLAQTAPMSGAAIVAMVVGLIGATGSIAAVLIGLGRVLASVDSLREESRKRGEEHAAELKALRTDLSSARADQRVSETQHEALEHRVAHVESELGRVRDRVHALADARHHGAAT